MFSNTAFDEELLPEHCTRHEKGSKFDSICDHPVVERLESIDALDRKCSGPNTGDLGAHPDQGMAEVDNFWLTGRILKNCCTFGQTCCEQEVFSATNGWHVEDDCRAFQSTVNVGLDISMADLDGRSKLSQTLEKLSTSAIP